MPTLNWIGKEVVVNHDREVPFKLLKKVKKASVGDSSQNLIIHGDNLEALKALMPYYIGKVKCIYIDPPYNTGNEGWVYNDRVNSPKIKQWLGKVVGRESEDLTRHDKWLCMMYPRLKLLRDLLADDGSIFISIDDNEQHHLRLLLSEIFSEDNFITEFCWRKTDNQANIGEIANVKEYIICFAKNYKRVSFQKIPLSEKAKYEYRYADQKGKFRRDILFHKTRGRHYYEVVTPSGAVLKGPWMLSEDKFKEKLDNDEIYWATGKMETPYGKIYLSDSKGQIISDLLGTEVGTNQQASIEIIKLFNKRIFDFPKPHTLIKQFLQISTKKEDIILDSFAGSGTTGHAVLDLNKEDGGNRKFIMVEMEDTVARDITAERVKRAIKKYEYKDSFEYCELDKPLFNEHGQIEETCDFKQFATYIYFTETQTNIDPKKIDQNYIGELGNTEYYLLYKGKNENDLDKSFLRKIKETSNKKVIYADRCLIDNKTLAQYNIVFKQIPYEVKVY